MSAPSAPLIAQVTGPVPSSSGSVDCIFINVLSPPARRVCVIPIGAALLAVVGSLRPHVVEHFAGKTISLVGAIASLAVRIAEIANAIIIQSTVKHWSSIVIWLAGAIDPCLIWAGSVGSSLGYVEIVLNRTPAIGRTEILALPRVAGVLISYGACTKPANTLARIIQQPVSPNAWIAISVGGTIAEIAPTIANLAGVVGAGFILASDVGPKSNGPRGHDGETGTVSVAPGMSVPFPVPRSAGQAVVMRVILAITGVALDGAFSVHIYIDMLDVIVAAAPRPTTAAPTVGGTAPACVVVADVIWQLILGVGTGWAPVVAVEKRPIILLIALPVVPIDPATGKPITTLTSSQLVRYLDIHY